MWHCKTTQLIEVAILMAKKVVTFFNFLAIYKWIVGANKIVYVIYTLKQRVADKLPHTP